MNKRSYFFILLLIMSFVFHSLGNFILANTYYVDRNHPSASNSNPGTLASPWLTIQHAAETLVAGDTVYIRTGIYNEHVFTVFSGNTSDGYIVFAAYPNEIPIIDGTGVLESQNGIIVDKTYIKLLGLEIRNWNETGIWLENAAYIEISDCVVHDVAYGIGAADGTHDFELNRVEMHHFDLFGFDASPSGGSDCYNGTLNDCIAYTGRDPGQNVDGFALGHGNQHDFTFNRCEAYDVYDGFDVGENAGGSQNNILLNRCFAHDCWNDGFKLTGQGTMVNCLSYDNINANVGIYWGYNPGTSVLHSCTFMNSESYNVWTESSNDSLQMFNCILAGGDNIGLGFELRDATVYTGDYNLFHNDNADRAISVGYEDEFSMSQIEAGAWTTYSGQDAHSQVAYMDTEIFLDATNFNLHLIDNSPAVDNGTATGAPNDDFEGNPRPSGQGYDIGAYEYQYGPDDVGDNYLDFNDKKYVLFQNYPNPFNPTTEINYSIPERSIITIKVFDALGMEVSTLVNKTQPQGNYKIEFDATDLTSGIYFYRLKAGDFVTSKKMNLVK